MAKLYAIEAASAYGLNAPGKAPGNVVHAQLKRMRGSFVSTGANNAAGDTIVIGRLPIGAVFDFGQITQSVSAGTTTIAIGIAGTPGLYRAAAVSTGVDTPQLFGVTAPMAAAAGLTAETEVFITLAVGALPAGTYCFDMYFTSVAS